MSESKHVVGIKPPDETWTKMAAAWCACEAAGVAPPESVTRFFEHERPDEAGVLVPLSSYNPAKQHACCEDWSDDMADGYEIDLTKLPADVKRLRFWVSY